MKHINFFIFFFSCFLVSSSVLAHQTVSIDKPSLRQRIKKTPTKVHQWHLRYKKLTDQVMAKFNLKRQRLVKY